MSMKKELQKKFYTRMFTSSNCGSLYCLKKT